jgi:putative transposase
MDSKSCPEPLGNEGSGRNPTDRGKQGIKLHLLVDKRGAPLSVIISSANRHDKSAAIDVLVAVVVERPSKPQHLCADAAYDSADVRDFVVLEGYTPHIKARPPAAFQPSTANPPQTIVQHEVREHRSSEAMPPRQKAIVASF